VKERATYILPILFLISLVFFSGCFSRVKEIDEVSGPTWVTSFTMPLVTRIEAEGYEIRLGDAPNKQGEKGMGLTGKDFSYRFVSDDLKWERRLETVKVGLGDFATITIPLGGSVILPDDGYGADVNLTGDDASNVSAIELSDNYSPGTLNDISIELAGGKAGPGGLAFFLVKYEGGVAGEEISRAELSKDESTGHLDLSGKTLVPGMRIIVTGKVEFTETSLTIILEGSELEIAAVTIDTAEKLKNLYKIEDTIDLGKIDLDEDRPEVSLTTASLEFIHDFPDEIQVNTKLNLESRDQSGSTLIDHEFPVDHLQGKGTETVDFTEEFVDIWNSDASAMGFKFIDFNLSLQGGEVKIALGTTLSLQVVPEIGFERITTVPKEVEVPEELKKSPLQAFLMYLEVTNTSTVGFELAIYLSPEENPVEDNNATKIGFAVKPAEGGRPGVYENTGNPITLDTDKLNYLTKGDVFYSQVEFIKTSGDTGAVTDNDYLEIRAWAQVDILVNKKEEGAK